MDRPFPLHQDVFKAPAPPIQVTPVHEGDANAPALLAALLDALGDAPLGLAGAYDKCKLTHIALAAPETAVLLRFAAPAKSKKAKARPPPASAGRAALAELLCSATVKLGSNVDRLAAALFLDHDLRLAGTVDIASIAVMKARSLRGGLDEIVAALGGPTVLGNLDRVQRVFESEGFSAQEVPLLALRAWACGMAGARDGVATALAQAPRYNTTEIATEELVVLAKLKRDQERLDALKPTKVKNDVLGEYSLKSKTLDLQQTRFKTRLRVSATQHVVVEYKPTPAQPRKTQVMGHAVRVNGKAAQVQLRGAPPVAGKIAGVYTFGKDAPTNAEAARAAIVRAALLRQSGVLRGGMARAIWLPAAAGGAVAAQAGAGRPATPPPIVWAGRPLNPSQTEAVRAIMDDKVITLIHGGPGTGKTTVIAAAVQSIVARDQTSTLWLVAQSNVAVKNIAEKLASCEFDDYRLLVSQDFHFDWHEHLYERIAPNVVRSDQLPQDLVAMERVLGGVRVVLCTLSMLSNSRVMAAGLARLVPIQTVVVDEASQIEAGDYLPLVGRFASTLKKIVCIGDDKQLPPYGQEDVPELQSVFELKHLKRNEVFLDTQYRMPMPLGNFLSKHVYSNRLKSEHSIHERNAVQFVDVPGEEKSQGHSWVNMKEVQAVVLIARILQGGGRHFRIITPYDAQRGRIEDALKAAKLKWEDTVFNVDSFQGNEADFIVVSLVRTAKPGFLANPRRTNVLLSRCKKGMLVCANRTFLAGDARAQKTLVGKMAAEWAEAGCEWKSWTELLQRKI